MLIITSFPAGYLVNSEDGYEVNINESTTYAAESGKNIKVSGAGVVANITLLGVTIGAGIGGGKHSLLKKQVLGY